MLKKRFLVAAAVLAAACSEIPEKDLLKFPVKQIADLPQAVALTPEKVLPDSSEVSSIIGFAVLNDKLIANADFMADHCLDVYDLASGELLQGLCRKGRGPGEFLFASFPLCSIEDESLFVYDVLAGKAAEVSLAEADFGCVTHQVSIETPKVGTPPVLMSHHKTAGGDVIAYNSIQAEVEYLAIENPYYALYDWNSGEEKRAYELFDASSVKGATSFALGDCLDDRGTTLCFAMNYMPVFGFLDLESGKVAGFRLKDAPAFSDKKRQAFFGGVSAQGENLFALYFGGKEDVGMSVSETDRTTLYKFDWEGKLLGKYELDGIYMICQATPDKLYLLKACGEPGWIPDYALYQLDMKDL